MDPDENLKPDIVGGHDLTSIRAIFDKDDKNLIVASNRQLFYYSVDSCKEVGRANIVSSKLVPDEKIAACERLDSSLYLVTNHGRIFIWSLETRDWANELALPLNNDTELLMSCKLLSKRQYIYSILDITTKKTTINYSMSRSERERPKQREMIGEITLGEQNTFDIGCFADNIESPCSNGGSQGSRGKGNPSKQRCLAYIFEDTVYFQKVAIGEKLNVARMKQRIQSPITYTCVRANPCRPMIATGDSLGRIYLYTGDFNKNTFNRTKLHWHTLPVSDLCFSSTGNTLFSTGGESGCLVIWDLSPNNVGQKRIIPRLGMPIRHLNCSNSLNQLVLSFEDNEIQFMDTSEQTRQVKTFTRKTIDMYKQNDYKALRIDAANYKAETSDSIGLLWHSKTDTVVTNGKTGWLQFYSPKDKSRFDSVDFLKSKVFSLEKEAKVIPSEITRATLTLDGDWLAFYETRESEGSFPDVKLHIWQRSNVTNRWSWVQTADRLHSSTSIVDLKYSPDGQFLISVSEDGAFLVLHRIFLDSKVSDRSKQMYTMGFSGNVPKNLPAMATFSQDSSVMAMSLKNDTTLIWMIVDPYKLVYECQLNQIETDVEISAGVNEDLAAFQPLHDVLGLHFGYHKPSQSLAPLCEVRTNSIRIWNILSSQETMEYSITDASTEDCEDNEFTAAAFDQCPGDSRSLDHFAVCTNKGLILIFRLQILPTSRTLTPLIVVDGTLPFSCPDTPFTYTDMCFLGTPILEIDPQCHQDPQTVKLLNRLCLMNNRQELVSITDKLTLERRSACNSCNAIRTFDMSELQAYFVKSESLYREETLGLPSASQPDSSTITEKQKKIRKRLEVQKMLKDVLMRIPSQNLPKIETLGPMILDKLV